jgi:ribosomal protein L32
MEIHTMKKLIAFFAIPLFIASDNYGMRHQPVFSDVPSEEAAFRLKGEYHRKKKSHDDLMYVYLNKCPKSGEFSLLQRVIFSSWVQECKDMEFELKTSAEVLRSYDN